MSQSPLKRQSDDQGSHLKFSNESKLLTLDLNPPLLCLLAEGIGQISGNMLYVVGYDPGEAVMENCEL